MWSAYVERRYRWPLVMRTLLAREAAKLTHEASGDPIQNCPRSSKQAKATTLNSTGFRERVSHKGGAYRAQCFGGGRTPASSKGRLNTDVVAGSMPTIFSHYFNNFPQRRRTRDCRFYPNRQLRHTARSHRQILDAVQSAPRAGRIATL